MHSSGIKKHRVMIYSFLIYLNFTFLTLLGFIFWIIAANLYPPSNIGISTSNISLVRLIVIFSTLGLNMTILRYFPLNINNHKRFFSVIAFTTFICTIVVVSLINILPFNLNFLEQTYLKNIFLLILISYIWLLFEILDAILVSLDIPLLILFKSGTFSVLKILTLSFLIFSFDSIISSWYFSAFISIILTIICIVGYRILFSGRKGEIINEKSEEHDSSNHLQLIKFSLYNYLVHIISLLPLTLLPILATEMYGAEQGAYFFISLTISNFLYAIPRSAVPPLLSDRSKSKLIIKRLLLILSGLTVIFTLLNTFILSFFGNFYVSSVTISILTLLLITSLPFCYNLIKTAEYNREYLLNEFLSVNAIILVCTLLFISFSNNVVDIAFSWFVGNILGTIFSIILDKRSLVFKKLKNIFQFLRGQ
ncbi:MAG: hypothetical protein ACFFAU_15015 [Candidatus Hodarchaeota archaeon]